MWGNRIALLFMILKSINASSYVSKYVEDDYTTLSIENQFNYLVLMLLWSPKLLRMNNWQMRFEITDAYICICFLIFSEDYIIKPENIYVQKNSTSTSAHFCDLLLAKIMITAMMRSTTKIKINTRAYHQIASSLTPFTCLMFAHAAQFCGSHRDGSNSVTITMLMPYFNEQSH